ncbi:GNAT family N-acetyltransferase [Streptomyces sp. NPDC020412]|uniref:GNAT family N-acetyltransferase n=1 Tax=Streptomyces sp. NPDC020412 TaxID=3365073 RepID=UPI0037AAB477
MTIRLAYEHDLSGLLDLAAEVEHWFGPMVDEPGFHGALAEHVRRGTALVAEDPGSEGTLLGGLLFDHFHAPLHHVDWLVVAQRSRGRGIGRALMAEAVDRYVTGPGTIEVVTFGPDHPGAVTSGARTFYEGLGFAPGEPTEPGPDGGSRQMYRRTVPAPALPRP